MRPLISLRFQLYSRYLACSGATSDLRRIVLDPVGGSETTALAGRNAIVLEINLDYAKMALTGWSKTAVDRDTVSLVDAVAV
jgi:DNA modification methylase